MKDERDLRDRTRSFALRIIRLFRQLAKAGDAQVIGKQLLRSGTSVGANYREACRSRSNAEKELDETAYWLELVVDAEIIPRAKMTDLLDETNQLLAVFTAISKNTKKRMAVR